VPVTDLEELIVLSAPWVGATIISFFVSSKRRFIAAKAIRLFGFELVVGENTLLMQVGDAFNRLQDVVRSVAAVRAAEVTSANAGSVEKKAIYPPKLFSASTTRDTSCSAASLCPSAVKWIPSACLKLTGGLIAHGTMIIPRDFSRASISSMSVCPLAWLAAVVLRLL
jgi:hypothetical protein